MRSPHCCVPPSTFEPDNQFLKKPDVKIMLGVHPSRPHFNFLPSVITWRMYDLVSLEQQFRPLK